MGQRGDFSFEDESTGVGNGDNGTGNSGSLGGDSGGGGGSGRDSSGGGDGGSGPLDPRNLAGGDTQSGSDERDSDGVRWDPDRHSSSRARTADGRWRVRRGLGGNTDRSSPRAQRRTAKDTLAVGEVRQFLAAIHAMAASVTRTPELELDNDDAQNLAVPLTEIANMYDVPVTKEMRLYSMLGIAIIMVYGPKYSEIRKRHKAERAHRVQPGPARPPPPTAGPEIILGTGGSFTGEPPVADPTKPIIPAKLQ